MKGDSAHVHTGVGIGLSPPTRLEKLSIQSTELEDAEGSFLSSGNS